MISNYDSTKIRMCGVEPESIVDGPGFRYVIFVQGCPHSCHGCHNPQSHDFKGGYEISVDDLWRDISKNSNLTGITFSGGEPFCQVAPLLDISYRAKSIGLNLMSYSGWTYDELLEKKDPIINEFLNNLDILVDGRYIESLRNLELKYRGSENQRVIDMNETRMSGTVKLYCP